METFLAIFVVSSIFERFHNHEQWIILLLIFIVFIILVKSIKNRLNRNQLRNIKKAEEKERGERKEKEIRIENEKKAQLKLEKMEETRDLVWSGTDICVNTDFTTENYEDFFAEFGNHPPIDLLFKELLQKENTEIISRDVRIFNMKEKYGGNGPIYYFYSFKREPSILSMSAKQILNCFIISMLAEKISTRNWFVLNTKYPEIPTGIDDLRMVDIRRFEEKGKFMLYCYPYQRWSSLGGSWLDLESTFFIPLLTEDNMVYEEITNG
ncbi:MAG: hypothetical protein KBD48_00030 [Candidatus Pacebacteria bacterium]|nr:hypothetical protein [Candidatus Paceibacterota bacterium]MBP9715567.1 hypothetical protein [Candidatus Paceibacterota bacterium]